MLADLVDGDDVRMLQPGDRLRLESETSDLGGTGVVAAKDHLERDFAIGSELDGPIDDTHAAAADLREDQ